MTDEIGKETEKEIGKEMKQEMMKSEIQPESGESSKLIGTPCGAVRGTVSAKGDCIVYKGIRYANAKRFQYPEEVTHWDGIYEADRFGNCSYQPRAFYDEAKVPEKAFYYHEFREGESYTYSEDCLFLNIWTPLEPENAPVLFYIHGGGFKGGCGHEKHFDGAAYCRQGILVVTINYRLGPLGFACMEEWKDEAGHAGNYAMYDQMAALSWVRRNIAAFGGNPDRITLMGQSAGAMSVQQHCLSPLTKGSICGAIMMSGGGVREGFAAAASLKDVEPFWRELDLRVTEACGKGLREAEPSVIFEAFNALSKERPDAAMVCGPIVDGAFCRSRPWKSSETARHTRSLISWALPVRISFLRLYIRWQRDGQDCSLTWEDALPMHSSLTGSCRGMTGAPGIPRICGMNSVRWKTAGVRLRPGTASFRTVWCAAFPILSAPEIPTAAAFPNGCL